MKTLKTTYKPNEETIYSMKQSLYLKYLLLIQY